ncbi:PREDICTED: uncharacterized protein LOC109482198 [Branchiostoma belcheri]|uniref:Uncharacterized protein LOC109482198 n=1 Tax=Branchiostoma belcheri TaxID=7741 RepID=A0A6P4ZGV1_BRABE|nr:PREDICTED: uncharacterized protein LOC109482198 [Branchiostoma belcheri]
MSYFQKEKTTLARLQTGSGEPAGANADSGGNPCTTPCAVTVTHGPEGDMSTEIGAAPRTTTDVADVDRRDSANEGNMVASTASAGETEPADSLKPVSGSSDGVPDTPTAPSKIEASTVCFVPYASNVPDIQHRPNTLYQNPIQNYSNPNTMYTQTVLSSDQNTHNDKAMPNVRIHNPHPESLGTSEPNVIIETSLVDDGDLATAARGEENLRDGATKDIAAGNEETDSRQADTEDSFRIEPYAVRYQDNDDDMTTRSNAAGRIAPDDVNIQPYAVAYIGQDDRTSSEETQARLPSHRGATALDIDNDESKMSSRCNSLRNDADASAVVAPNNLIKNPIYVPQQEDSVLGGIFFFLFFKGVPAFNSTMQETTKVPPGSIPMVTASTSPLVPTSSLETRGRVGKIVFGGHGKDPGKFDESLGVAISADEEIFVTDVFNKRIQVYNMGGIHLRLFPTVVPGENETMHPFDVAISSDEHLWVALKKDLYKRDVYVVQYRKDGHPLSKFDLQMSTTYYPSIAVDATNNKIIVAGSSQLCVFHPNGSFHQSFGAEGLLISSVTVDNEGHILVTQTAAAKYRQYSEAASSYGVHVYDHRGRWLYEFFALRGEYRRHFPRGICVDGSGHIFVADTGTGSVAMFTSLGKFVRTVVRVARPRGIALGPGGQLVVTNPQAGTVTIFPRQMVASTRSS